MAPLLALQAAQSVDEVRLNFSPESLTALNICLGFIMFGVALNLRITDFKKLAETPKSAVTALVSQWIALPLLSLALVVVLKPPPSIALGMLLVSACPGGNVSNFMSLTAKGNAALSVGITTVSTLLCIVMTPLVFAGLVAASGLGASDIDLSIDPIGMVKTVATIIIFPLVVGMLLAEKAPNIVEKMKKPMSILSMLIFLAFVLIAFSKNWEHFLEHIGQVFFLVMIHNAVALATGYGLAKLVRLPERDSRSVSIETGIQNSGLGLVLIFNFFDGLGGMAMVAAWWGIWHLFSGMGIATFWARRDPDGPKPEPPGADLGGAATS